MEQGSGITGAIEEGFNGWQNDALAVIIAFVLLSFLIILADIVGKHVFKASSKKVVEHYHTHEKEEDEDDD